MASEEKWFGPVQGEFVEDVKPSTRPSIIDIIEEYEEFWPRHVRRAVERIFEPVERIFERLIKTILHRPWDEEFVEDEEPVVGPDVVTEYELDD